MILWLNGSFGVGKSTTAEILHGYLPRSHIYDPEQAGYFLWHIFPQEMKRKGDFQDIPIWRYINYDIIRYLYGTYDGDIIIPMTIADVRCYRDIILRLMSDGAELLHFILTASRQSIAERLLKRGEPPGSWPEQQIERCLRAFEKDIRGIAIDTSHTDANGAAEAILSAWRAAKNTPAKEFCIP